MRPVTRRTVHAADDFVHAVDCYVRAPKGHGEMKKRKVNTLARAAESAGSRRANDLLELVVRRMQRITEDFYDIGEALRELQDKKLFRVLGFKTLGDLLKAHKLMSRSKAFELIHIVKTVPRKQALAFGPEKAYAMARLTAATPQLDTVEEIARDGVVVRGRRRPVSEVTAEQIESRARSVRGTAKVDPGERDARRAAREVQAALRKQGARTAAVEATRLGGAWSLRITLAVAERGALGT